MESEKESRNKTANQKLKNEVKQLKKQLLHWEKESQNQTAIQELKSEVKQLKKQQLQSEKEFRNKLLSVQKTVKKLKRYIREFDREGTCYTTFAYDFDYVILANYNEEEREN